MILDTSAVIAILKREPGYDPLVDKIVRAGERSIGTPTLAECGLVISGSMGRDGATVMGEFLRRFRVSEIAFDGVHRSVAVEAFHRFGKGRHPASLNFGDCMSYAGVAGLGAASPLHRQRLPTNRPSPRLTRRPTRRAAGGPSSSAGPVPATGRRARSGRRRASTAGRRGAG